jgi:hypothetical protein
MLKKSGAIVFGKILGEDSGPRSNRFFWEQIFSVEDYVIPEQEHEHFD